MKPPVWKILLRFTMLLILMVLLIFVPAGTFNFWQGYVLAAILLIPMFFTFLYFLWHDPEFLLRRGQFKEKEVQQKLIMGLSAPVFLAGFIISGLDHRFSWSAVPVFVNILADVLILAGYIVVIIVFRQNRFASRIIEVTENQQVITTGLYGLVRHPMYLGVLMMYISVPVALGSYWGLIPMSILPVVLVFRILNEERVLSESLQGYTAYCQKTRYRLIPFIW